MNETMLKSFLQILAVIKVLKKDENHQLIRKYLEGYIERNFSKGIVKSKLDEFDEFLTIINLSSNKRDLLQQVCKSINKEYPLKQKFLLLVNVLNYYSFYNRLNFTLPEEDELEQIAEFLNINSNDYTSCKYFAMGEMHHIPLKTNLLLLANENSGFSEIKFLKLEGIKGYLFFLYIPDADVIVFKYKGSILLELNGKPIFSNLTYIFSSGFLISGVGLKSIYYGQILKSIIQTDQSSQVCLVASNISFFYPDYKKGVCNISLQGTSGEMIGVMGGSGTGKSTLLKLLSGGIIAHEGKVLINGLNIDSITKTHKGIFGVMNQEDCLVEELTVFENLLYSAHLSLGDLPRNEILKIVENTLFEFGLIDCRNNKVGSVGNRQLSGGQRKRLAIAVEIIREPKILLVDEPTSGLSSSDSEAVMNIFKSIALEGKLVIVNIHQPSSEIFKLFDSILILDQGGIPVFSGNPAEAIIHFKTIANRVDKHMSSCETCGNMKPEQIFEIVEEQKINELGQTTQIRKLSPKEWHQFYLQNLSSKSKFNQKNELPHNSHHVVTRFSQFILFTKRNMLAKIRNLEFIYLALILPPLLATFIAVFLRYASPFDSKISSYTLYFNPNLASFFLMSILASLFFGLILSCEDILHDKQLIARESFIGLSLKSFYNSKLITLLLLSAYQTFTFSIIGTIIIELRGITLHFWFMLLLVSAIGNIVGLIVSSTLKSVVAIYILVPFLLIPQILFSGLVVRFDNLNSKLTSESSVPLVGELMVTRWATEAIITHYYINNEYNKPLFNFDFQESELRYKLLYLLPEIQHTLNSTITEYSSEHELLCPSTRALVENGIFTLSQGVRNPPDSIFSCPNSLFADFTFPYLVQVKEEFSNRYSRIVSGRDRLIESLYSNTPKGREIQLLKRNQHHNKAIDDFLKNRYYPNPIVVSNGNFVQKIDPIFQISPSSFGRSHFLAPYKQIGKYLFETYWYNVLIMILMTIVFYLILIFNIFPKLKYFSQYKLKLKKHAAFI